MNKKYTACVAASLAMTVTLVACTPPGAADQYKTPHRTFDLSKGEVYRFEDDERGVTCWVYDGASAGAALTPHAKPWNRQTTGGAWHDL